MYNLASTKAGVFNNNKDIHILLPKENVHEIHLIITSRTGLSGSLISKSVAVEKQLVLLHTQRE